MDLDDNGATAEDIIQEVPEVNENKSMEDTMLETLKGLKESQGDSTTETAEAAPTTGTEEQVKEKPSRLRDETGKFKATEEEPQETAAVTDPLAEAPNTWKKEAKEAWAKADPVIRAEVARREADFHKGIEQYKSAAQYAQAIDMAISPYKQTMQKLGISPDKAIAELMSADHKLRYGTAGEKQAYFMQLAQNYGVDLSSAAEVQRNIDPNLYKLELQNRQLQEQLQAHQNQAQYQLHNSLNSEINQFASDPKNVHFEAVRGHMSALLQAGQVQTLQDAYDQAVYANPTTRAAMLQQQQQALREEAAKKAQVAKQAASVNVRSRPALQPQEAVATMDDTMRAILAKHNVR